MPWTVALTLGAVGGALRNRRWAALVPGLILALAAGWAFRGIPPVWLSPESAVRRVALPLTGAVCGLYVSPRPHHRFDLPLDLRIAAALVLGFSARGGIVIFRELIHSLRR